MYKFSQYFLVIQILPYSSVPNRNRTAYALDGVVQILPYSSVPNRNNRPGNTI